MKKYTNEFFTQQAQSFYKEHQRLPKTRDFSWGSTALRRFGSWNYFLLAAELISPSQELDEQLKRKKEKLWTELLQITYLEGWYENEGNTRRVSQLREEIDKINKKR